MKAPSLFVVTGPPGAGKTTAARALTARWRHIAQFGVRDYALALSARGEPLAEQLIPTILAGRLLPDELVAAELAHCIDNISPETAVLIVEGYPRSRQQVVDLFGLALNRGLAVCGLYILDLSSNEALARTYDRVICHACGISYDKSVKRCIQCQAETQRRADDAALTAARRVSDYESQIHHIVASFSRLGAPVKKIDASQATNPIVSLLEQEMQAIMPTGGFG